MLEVRNLSKRFKETEAVKSLSFSLKLGETLALTGTSGSGKTTALKMINRLIEADEGEVLIAGENILTQKPHKLRQKIGYVIQHTGLFPHLNIEQNIETVLRLLAWKTADIKQRTEELMQMMQLPLEFLHKKPSALSGGQQQRVGIARALAGKPRLLLMDEPFGALDTLTRQSIAKEFKHWTKKEGCTTLIITHDLAEAAFLGDQIALMSKGALLQIGNTFELLQNPADLFVKNFFADRASEIRQKITPLHTWLPLLSGLNSDKIKSVATLPSISQDDTLFEVMKTCTAASQHSKYLRVVDKQGQTIKLIAQNELSRLFFL